jgi:hypothetical protein
VAEVALCPLDVEVPPEPVVSVTLGEQPAAAARAPPVARSAVRTSVRMSRA